MAILTKINIKRLALKNNTNAQYDNQMSFHFRLFISNVNYLVLRIWNDLFRIIPDPDPALNFSSSGSGSRQKFRIHADQDPTLVFLRIFGNYK